MVAPPRLLLCTAVASLREEVLRAAAVAGREVEVCADPTSVRVGWRDAPLVLVGADLATSLAGHRLPRRPAVCVLSEAGADPETWRGAVALGAERVLELPGESALLAGLLAGAGEAAEEAAAIVAVLGGRGGAGASTLAVALAVTAARQGRRTLLVDLDPLGGGLDLLLGAEEVAGLRWPDLVHARGRLSGEELAGALPRSHRLTVLSWDRGDVVTLPVAALRTVLRAASPLHDLVVADLPRRPDDAATEALARSVVALLVVPAEVRATAAAARVAATAGLVAADLRVVVRGPAPGGLAADLVAGSLGLPLAGTLRPEPGLAAAQERGEPPARGGRGPLARFCRRFLAGLPAPARRAAA